MSLPSASPNKLVDGGGTVLDHEAINQAWGDMLDGIARIMKYDPNLGARYYLGKYLAKEVADIQYSPQLRENHRRAVVRLAKT